MSRCAYILPEPVFFLLFHPVWYAFPTCLHNSEDMEVDRHGFQRIYPSGEAEIIRWDQIRHMKWARFLGLTIRWEESKGEHQSRSKIFRDEFRLDSFCRQYRAALFVQKEEAGTLTSIAKNKRIPVDWYELW